MLAKTKIQKNQKIIKKLRQGVNIGLKRQVCPNIFNVNMICLQEDIWEDLTKYVNMKTARGVMLAHRLLDY